MIIAVGDVATAPTGAVDLALRLGPHHPSSHGLIRLRVSLDGDRIASAQPLIGHVHRGADRDDMRDFLEAVHRITTVEHESDKAHRAIKSLLLATESDSRGLFVVAEVARNLEEAADALMHSGLVLRDHVMGAVAGN